MFLECASVAFCQTDIKIMSDTIAHVHSKLKTKMWVLKCISLSVKKVS